MKFLVCNKWELEIADKYIDSDFSGKGIDRPYFQFVVQRPKEVAREAWCYEHILSHVLRIALTRSLQVAEYFGGMGMNATQIQNMLDVEYHATNDRDPRSHTHLTDMDIFDEVTLEDALSLAGDWRFDCDLVTLDFNSFTVLQLIRDATLLAAFDNIMDNEPLYVILTDSAVNKIHLNYHIYTQAMNANVESIGDYALAFSKWLEDRYGYSILHGAYHHAASYFLIAPQSLVTDALTMIKAPKEADTCFRKIS